MRIDRKKFFDGIRQGPFPGKLSVKQVSGTAAILDEWERRKLTDLRDLSYMMATAKLETAHTMQPIQEGGGPKYFTKMYDIAGARAALARRNGNTTRGDGIRYCGRGYVQLTWKNNYATLTKALRAAGINVDLVNNPELAMRPDIAAFIMFEGMERGLFTSKKLDDYFNDKKTDWIGARKIINGNDRAAEIAEIAKQFYTDLNLAAAA